MVCAVGLLLQIRSEICAQLEEQKSVQQTAIDHLMKANKELSEKIVELNSEIIRRCEHINQVKQSNESIELTTKELIKGNQQLKETLQSLKMDVSGYCMLWLFSKQCSTLF